jgi:hypothetical protein
VDWLAEGNVSEKLSVSIFRAKVRLTTSTLKMEAAGFSKTLAYTNQPTRRRNPPKERNQNYG